MVRRKRTPRRESVPRRRKPWRRRIAVLAAVVLVAAACWIVPALLARRVHEEIASTLAATLDAEVALGSTKLELLPPRLTLTGLSVRREGVELGGASRVEVHVDGAAWLRGRRVVTRLVVREPSMVLGENGLDLTSRRAPAASGAPDLEIRRLELTDGAVEWSSGDTRLHVTEVSARARRLLRGRRGSVALTGRVVAAGPATQLLGGAALDATVAFDEEGVTVSELSVAAERTLHAVGAGHLRTQGDGPGPAWEISVRGEASPAALPMESLLPAGSRVEGDLRFALEASGAGSAWRAAGDLTAPRLSWLRPTDDAVELGDLRVRFEAPEAGPAVARARATLAGGTLDVEGRLPWREPTRVLAFQAHADGLRLEDLPGVAPLAGMEAARAGVLSGHLSGSVPLDEPSACVARVDLELRAPGGPGRPPAELALSADVSAAGLSVDRADLTAPALRARASGALGWDGRSALSVRLAAPSLAAGLAAWRSVLPPALTRRALEGALVLEGELTGTPSAPTFRGSLAASALELDGVALGELRAALRADRSMLRLHAASLRGAAGTATGEVTVPWGEVAAATGAVDVERVALRDVATLSGTSHHLGGVLEGRLTLRPGDGAPQLAVELLVPAGSVDDLTFHDLALRAALTGDALEVQAAEVRIAGGHLAADGALSLDAGGRELHVRAAGLSLSEMGLDAGDVTGIVSADLTLGGTLSSPVPTGPARWAVEQLVVAGRELGRFEGELLPTDTGGEFRMRGLDGALRGAGRIGTPEEPSIEARIELDLLDLDLGEVDEERTTVAAEGLTLAVVGLLTEPTSLRHELAIRRLRAGWKGLDLSAPEGLRLTGVGTAIRGAGLRLLVGGQLVEVDGMVRVGDPLRHEVRMRGTVDLADLEAWFPDAQLAGSALFEVASQGEGSHVDLDGELRVREGSLRVRGFPQSLEDVEAVAAFDGERVEVKRLTGTLGGGRVSGTGFVHLPALRPGRHELTLEGEDVELRLPDVLRASSSFSLSLAGDEEGGVLAGTVTVHEARYTRDVRLEAALAAPGRAPPRSTTPGPLDRLRLDLSVAATSGVHVDNDLVAVELMGDVAIVGTASRPVLVGFGNAIDEGRLTFQGTRYRLTEGAVTFSLAHPNDPELAILAETRLAEHDIELRLTGRASDPRVDLNSTPALPTERIVALLATRGAVGAGSGDLVPGELAADFLNGRMGRVDAALQRLTGLDVFELEPSLGQGQGDHLARLTVGKRLTEDVTAIVSTDLGGDSASSASLRWQASRGLAVRAAREASGTSALGVTWSRPRRPPPPLAAASTDGFTIGEIECQGLPPGLAAAEASATLALEPGTTTTVRQLRRAAARLREALHERGHVLARVRCTRTGAAEPADVTCQVEPGPEVDLEVRGKLDRGLERRLREAVAREWHESFRLEDLAPEARRTALSVLAEHGHANASVHATEMRSAARHLVIAEVSPGPRIKVRTFEFAGAASIPTSRLRSAARSAAPPTLRRPLLTPSLLADAAAAVADLYRSEGWMDVEVEDPSWSVGADGTAAVVTWSVSEGPRYDVSSMELVGPTLPTTSDLAERLAATVGTGLRPQDLDAACRALVARHDAAGHPEATARWDWRPTAEGAAVTVTVVPGPRIDVGEVTLTGAGRTRERVIRKTARVESGQPYSRDHVSAATRRLLETGLFARAVVRGLTADAASGTRDVVIDVAERDPVRLTVGAGLDDEEGPHFTFSLAHANVRGTGRSVATNLRLGEVERHAELAVRARAFSDASVQLLGSTGLGQEKETGFVVQRAWAGLEASAPAPWRGRWQATARLEDVRLHDVRVAGADLDLDEGLFAELGIALTRDTRDQALLPTRGSLSSVRLSAAAGVADSHARHVRLFLRHAAFRPVTRWMTFATSARLGLGWPLAGARLPLAERFRAGGATTVRGFRRDALGPRDALTDEPLGGDAVLILNQELSIAVGERLTAHVFADVGNVLASAGDVTSLDLRLSSGVGLGVRTPIGPLRLYHAWVIDREPGEPRGRFHFAIASTF